MTETSDLWAALKARLVKDLGREGAAHWLAFAADVMAREHRIESGQTLKPAQISKLARSA